MNASIRLPIEEISSLAFRDGEAVHVHLHLVDTGWQSGSVSVRLTSEDRRFRVDGLVTDTGDGVRLEVVVPGKRLRRDVWSLSMQPHAGASFIRLQVRLLAKPGQPVALLPGPRPTTRLAAPPPRSPEPRAVSTASRAVGRLRRILREKRQ